jgi:hypothetical protein
MKLIPWLFIDVALAFLAFTVYVLFEMGVGPAFATVPHNLATWQMTGDIVLGLGAAAVLMVLDARKNGINPLPFVGLTVFLGAPGPLFYLARRFWPLTRA